MDKVTITTIKNPFDQNDRDIERVDYIPKGSVKSYVLKDGQISENDLVVSVNAGIVPFEKWDSFAINAGDYIAVCPVLGKSGKSKEIVSLIAGIALSVVSMGVGSVLSGGAFMGTGALSMGAWSWGGYLAALAVMAVGGMLLSKMQPKLEMDTNQTATRYSWSPQPMAIGQGYPLNIIYGTVRPTPLILAQHVTADGVNQYLNLLLCLGDGPVDSITNIRVNGNPIANYNIVPDLRYGSNNQSVIPNFSDTFADQNISFELVPAQGGQITPWSYQETDGNSAQGLEIEISFPTGLYQSNSETGSAEATNVTIEAAYQRIGGAWINFFSTANVVISDTSTAPTRRTYRVDNIPTGKYNVRVRCTAKSSSLITTVNRVYWSMLSSIVYDDFQRPGKVLLGLKALATSQLSGGIPTVTCNVTRSNVYVWNPTASAYQAKPANNPAWAAYDLIHRAKLFNSPYWNASITIDGTPRVLKVSTENLVTSPPQYTLAAGDVQSAVRQYDSLATAVWNGGITKFVVGFSAVRIGGTGVSTNIDPWAAITDGSFNITIDGVSRDITGINFPAGYTELRGGPIWTAGDMPAVAHIIQEAINAIGTGGFTDAAVTWESGTTCFKIRSGSTGSSATIAPLTAAASGTDISSTSFMKMRSGQESSYTIGFNSTIDPPAVTSEYTVFGAAKEKLIYQDFYNWAANCTTKSLTINYIVDKTNDLWTALKEFENCGRGKVVTKGTKFGCIFDAAGTAVQMFTMGNIIKDSFREEFLPTKDRANALEITFTNKDKDYQRDVISIYTDDYDTATEVKNPTQVTFDGIDNFAQAYSEGKYRLRLNKYLNRVIYFDADVDSIACQVGDIINFQHDVPQWGLAGGRCVSCNPAGTEITIDAVVTLEANQAYTIMLRHPASDTLITRTIAADADERADISIIPVTVSVGYSTLDYDWIYALGKTNIQTKPFRVTNITRSTKLRRKLTCLEYVAAIYDEATDPPVITYSELDPFDEVTSLTTTTDTFTQKDGTVLSVIYANWRVPRAARSMKFSVYYALGIIATPGPGSANWIKHSEGGELGVTIEGVAALQYYTVKVCVVNDLGIESPGTVSSLYVAGKDTKPDNVTNLTVTADPSDHTKFNLAWDKVANLDLHHYKIYVNRTDGTLVYLTAPDNNFIYTATHTGSQYVDFKVRAVDNSGNESELWSNMVTLTVKTNPADVTGFAAVLNKYNLMQVDLYWNANAENDITEYIIYKNDTNTTPLDANIIWRGNATARTVNLENGIHTLKIYARNVAGFKSLNAATATFKIDFTPGNVTGLTATRDTTYRNRINLEWDPITETYEYCYHFDVTSEYQNTALDVTKDLTTAVFKALDSGSHYVFSLVAKNAFGNQVSATPVTTSITTNFSPNNVADFAAIVDNGKKAFSDSYIYTSMAKINGTSAVMAAQNETDNKGEIIKLTGLDGVITAANTIDLISGGGAVKATSTVLIDSTSALVAYVDSSDVGYAVKITGLDGTPSAGTPVKFSTDGETITHISLALISSAIALVAFGSSNTFHRGQLSKITGLDGTMAAGTPETYSTFETRHNALLGIDSTSAMLAFANYADSSGTPKIVKITGLDTGLTIGTPVTIESSVYFNFIKGLTGLSAVKINSTTAILAGSSSVQLLYVVKITGLDGTLSYSEPVGYDVDYGYTTPVLAVVNSTTALLAARDATNSEGVIFNIQGLDGTLLFGVNKFRYNYLSEDATYAALITISGTKAVIAFKNIDTGVCNVVRVEAIDTAILTFAAVVTHLNWSEITDKFPNDYYALKVGATTDDWNTAQTWSGSHGPDSSAITGLTTTYLEPGAATLKFFIKAIAPIGPESLDTYESATAATVTVNY